MSFNATAISFCISTLLSAFIAWRGFSIWKKQRENEAGRAFFQAILCLSFYVGVRALASFWFADTPYALTVLYILSHVFLGIAAAFIAKFASVSFFDLSLANLVFRVVLVLFVPDIILNILLPNQPHFNSALNIIEWGSNKYVGIYHSLLLWSIFLAAAILFAYKARQNWSDRTIRNRSLLIAAGLLLCILVVIPRNVFRTPLFILISDVGYSLSFGIILWAISFPHQKEKENEKVRDFRAQSRFKN